MLGSKIENLVKLQKQNINIPEFFIITQDEVLKERIEVPILKNKNHQELEKISEELKKDLEKKFKLTLNNTLNEKLYSVRSSSNLEDSKDSSFAGQFTTFLNVKEENLEKRILDCFKSLYNTNVLEYMNKNNKNINDLRMNVIVQKMVSSDLSGVIFTSNPQGILNESVLVVAKGLGENVVADKGDTTSYYYNKTDQKYYYSGEIDLISKEKIEELLTLSTQIEKILGKYLDIEFAIKDENIYILQARKITTLKEDKPLILDNSNIVESYPGISLPLTCSFVNNVYSGIFKGICQRILQNKQDLEELNPVFKNMVGSVNGRIYYKISNWYTIIKHLPLSNKIIPIWQEMLGVKNKSYDADELKLTFSKKIRIYKNSIVELIKTPKNMNKLNKEFIKINKHFYDNYNDAITPQELLKLYKDIENKLLSCWDITLLNDLYAFIFTGLLKNRLKKKYPNNEDIANKYISGITNIESMKPIQELINIAYEEKDITSKNYFQRKEKYIEIYGDRNLEELKLESKTFRTTPNLFDQKIKEYQVDYKKLKTLYQNMNKEDENIITEDFITKYLIKKCTLGIKNREISRLNRSRIFGIVREIFLYYGKYFTNEKLLTKKEDIFYLTIEEVIENIDTKKDLRDIVIDRKKQYEIYGKLPSYTRLIFMDKEFNKTLVNIKINKEEKNKNILYGIPCSSGFVEAEALVIEDISNIGDVKDKILVTKMTDPGWVFLLATAKGILSEKGSLLSHTAIISRELKIPSIVGVKDLLSTIKTGDIIKMDATTGKIEIKKRK